MKEVDFLSSSETAFVYALCVHVFHSQVLPWDLIKLLKMSLHHYGVKRICWKFHKRTKLWKMSRSQRGTILLPPTVRSYINLARKWIPRNCVQKWARATKTFRPKKIQCNVNVAMVGTVKRHCQSLVVSIWYLMWDQEEVSDCQIVKYKYLTSTNRWQPFDDHWGTSVASELNLWDNFQQPMGGRSLYSLMVGRNFDGPPI